MKYLKKLPLPFSGVTLATFALANLMKRHEMIYESFSILGVFFMIMLTLKFIFGPKETMQQLNHPVVSSVAPTYSMAFMLMSVYLKGKGLDTPVLWYTGIVIHLALMVNYSIKFILNFDLKKIFPSIFIVYVGIVVTSVTAPAFSLKTGQFFFYFGLITLIPLMLLVIKRLKTFAMPEPAQATFAIMAAPVNLCLAGYLSAFPVKNEIIVWGLLGFGLITTLVVLIQLPKMLKLSFSPSYAAFTFPLVISAIATKKASMYLKLNWLKPVATLETYLAAAIVIYVLIRFATFMLQKNSIKKNKAA